MLRYESDILVQFQTALRGGFDSLAPVTFGSQMLAPDQRDAGFALAAELGSFGMMIPEADGGLGDMPAEFATICAALGQNLSAAPVLAHWAATKVITQAPDFAGKAELLEKAISGDLQLALAGLVPAAQQMDIVAAEGEFVLTGRQRNVMGLGQADQVVLLARGHVFLLDHAEVAPHSTPYRLIDGQVAGDLGMDGVKLSGSSLIASGFHQAQIGAWVALGLGADAIGSAARVIALTTDYMKIRKQFGTALSEFQALQHQLAEAVADLELARALLDAALDATGDFDAASAHFALFATKAHRQIAERMIQISGGIGITEEYEAGHHYRRAMVLEGLVKSQLDLAALTASVLGQAA